MESDLESPLPPSTPSTTSIDLSIRGSEQAKVQNQNKKCPNSTSHAALISLPPARPLDYLLISRPESESSGEKERERKTRRARARTLRHAAPVEAIGRGLLRRTAGALAFPPKPRGSFRYESSSPMTGTPRSLLFSVDVVDVLRRLHRAGFCLDLDAPGDGEAGLSPEKMGAFFERTVYLLFEENHRKGESVVRPFPAMLGDGRTVDLFRLYSAVRGKGGYRSVTAAGSWGLVAGETGLDASLGSALKLIYAKYLGVLDRRLREASRREGGGSAGRAEDGESFFGKDGEGNGGWFRGVLNQKGGGGEGTPSSKKEHAWAWLKGCRLKEQLDNGREGDDVVVIETVDGRAKSPCLKRKRECESLAGVLDWLRAVAKNPGSPIGSTQLDRSESKYLEVAKPLSQALLLREALVANLAYTWVHDVPLSQKRQKVHPSIYDDSPDTDVINEKSRCSQRIISLKKKLQVASLSGAAIVPNGESDKDSIETESEGINDKQYSRDHNLSHVAGIYGKQQKCVRIGPEHQANVPEWTGRGSSDDMNSEEFLGKRIWPLERKEQKPGIKQDLVGRGRRGTCSCVHRGTVKCARFHVAEKRFLLKRELGSAFYSMGFHHMGEEVSLTWTKEEEQKFKATVHQNPPLSTSFWEMVSVCFPFKTTQSLVRYYFNVFILQQRSYQNRVTPEEIDSDDDESELSFLSDAFGRNAGEIRNPKPIVCVQNAQCMSLDELSDTDNT
ncbi:hypothetical protein Taro_009879 [Colocasia esculenta]|uniref:AT-rich interactive domain-containing protein 2 n=1 Tax=Colocasia esculenta TaxID=4460 RepID=A0A843U247_COLES|nr:hypothetical protein [Colocasia esculenta]